MTPKNYILDLLQNEGVAIQDDLNRARATFSDLTPTQMQEQYGQSGETKAHILETYEEKLRDHQAAVSWIKSKQ